MLQRAAVIVQAEQQRADRVLARLVPAKSRHHAVGGAGVLDLEHRALAGLVGAVETFRHHAVESCALEAVEPVGRERDVGGGRRQMDRRDDMAED